METRIKSACELLPAVKADFLRVQFIKIVQDAADGVAFVVVGLLFKNTDRDGVAVEHQILADVTAGVGETVRKLIGSGKQQQTRRFRSVGGENDGFAALQVHIFLFVEIDSPTPAPALVDPTFA